MHAPQPLQICGADLQGRWELLGRAQYRVHFLASQIELQPTGELGNMVNKTCLFLKECYNWLLNSMLQFLISSICH